MGSYRTAKWVGDQKRLEYEPSLPSHRVELSITLTGVLWNFGHSLCTTCFFTLFNPGVGTRVLEFGPLIISQFINSSYTNMFCYLLLFLRFSYVWLLVNSSLELKIFTIDFSSFKSVVFFLMPNEKWFINFL